MPLPRFRIRTLMIAVALAGVVMGIPRKNMEAYFAIVPFCLIVLVAIAPPLLLLLGSIWGALVLSRAVGRVLRRRRGIRDGRVPLTGSPHASPPDDPAALDDRGGSSTYPVKPRIG